MSSTEPTGVAFPTVAGRRSTSDLGRAVAADALRPVDPVGALAAEQETNWRSGYLAHYRRLLEAGLGSRQDAVELANAGLASIHSRLRILTSGGERPLSEWQSDGPGHVFGTAETRGAAEPETELSLPYHGHRLRGDQLRGRLDAWVRDGIVEPTARDAVHAVLDNPEWLRLDGHVVAVLGAGAEMGPLRALLRFGATAAAVDLPRPQLWIELLEAATAGAGRLLLPTRAGRTEPDPSTLGADLTAEVPELAEWLGGLDGKLVLGNYVYADGADNVRVSAAVDALTVRVLEQRPDASLGFLATPTDVFAVPAEAVDHSTRSYDARSSTAKLLGRPLRAVSGGRLLRRAYVPGSDPGINDSLVSQQGPNYALAKRLQRWRAASARDAGATVSMNVAPPTRTRSVTKNRALAAAYAGAHRFGVEVFEPATSNVLMAALLVHDLNTGGGPRHDHPWQDEAFAAVHGGLWRTAYAPRSALGLAALMGYGARG